jgi:hypothetical protein
LSCTWIMKYPSGIQGNSWMLGRNILNKQRSLPTEAETAVFIVALCLSWQLSVHLTAFQHQSHFTQRDNGVYKIERQIINVYLQLCLCVKGNKVATEGIKVALQVITTEFHVVMCRRVGRLWIKSSGYSLLHCAARLFLCADSMLITEMRVRSLPVSPGANKLALL